MNSASLRLLSIACAGTLASPAPTDDVLEDDDEPPQFHAPRRAPEEDATVGEWSPKHNFIKERNEGHQQSSAFAYVTVLRRDDDAGVRTLGQSIIESGSTVDRLVLLDPWVGSDTAHRLSNQGWIVKPLRVFQDALHQSIDRSKVDDWIDETFARIALWSLTNYERIVFLEDNMLVMKNIDDLFQCKGICAGMQQAELIRASLVVLEPDQETYQSMLISVKGTFSYSKDFGGFLNSYLTGFESCSFFDLGSPSLQDPAMDPRHGPYADLLDHSCHRLPSRYNGEFSVMMLNGGLHMVHAKNEMPELWWDQRRARVVSFGFAGLRPWDWYVAPFTPYVSMWEAVHARAEPRDPRPNLFRPIATWLLWVWIGTCGLRMVAPRRKGGAGVAPSRRGGKGRMAAGGVCFSRFGGDRGGDRGDDGGGVTEITIGIDGGTTTTGIGGAGGGGGGEGIRSRVRPVPKAKARRKRGVAALEYNPRRLVWSLAHLVVGYSSLVFAVLIAISKVPEAGGVGLSWMIFISWTCMVFGLLWAFYLALVSRLASKSPRPLSTLAGGSALDLAHMAMAYADTGVQGAPGEETPAASRRSGAGVPVGGKGAPSSPWGESVRSLTCLVILMGVLPSWKPLSRADSLRMLLGPVFLVLLVMFMGLTVQMIRLPVLWCDWSQVRTDKGRDGRDA